MAIKEILLILAAAFSMSLRAETKWQGGTELVFASVDQGRQVLTNRDDFVERLSPFDRAARLKTAAEVSEAQYLNFVRTNVLEFTPVEKASVERAFLEIKPGLEKLKLSWPTPVLLIKTTGLEEGTAPHTRGNAVVLPAEKLQGVIDPSILAHELFHVLSRHNPALKDKLYAAIGFQKCDEIKFPSTLMRITNPDAPRNDHFIDLTVDGKTVSAIPILFAKPKSYDTQKGGEFFDYLNFEFLAVQKVPGSSAVNFDSDHPQLLEMDKVRGFYEQVGQNTSYVIHPEEILADNFVLLLKPGSQVTSPEILEKIRKALAGPAN